MVGLAEFRATAPGSRTRKGCWLATRHERRSGGSGRRTGRGTRASLDNEGLIPVLAKAVREIQTAIERGQVTAGQRSRLQAVALLVRAERARVQADSSLAEARRNT